MISDYLAQAICVSVEMDVFNQAIVDTIYISHWIAHYGVKIYPVIIIAMLGKTYVFS